MTDYSTAGLDDLSSWAAAKRKSEAGRWTEVGREVRRVKIYEHLGMLNREEM